MANKLCDAISASFGKVASVPLTLKHGYNTSAVYFSIFGHPQDCIGSYAERHLFGEEKNYFNELKVEKRKKNYLLGRISAKNSVAHLTGVSNEKKIEIHYGVFNQPIVKCQGHSNIQVSISHSDNYGASLAFQEAYPIGIDIEEASHDRAGLAKSQLSEFEINNHLAKDRYSPIMLWTAKEALSKALKTGLLCDFNLYEISKIGKIGHYIECQFTKFPQYKTLSFFSDNIYVSLALPHDTNLE